jgi:hypothetical protein
LTERHFYKTQGPGGAGKRREGPGNCYFSKKIDYNIGFWGNRQFFRRKLAKIAELVIITSTTDEFVKKSPNVAQYIFVKINAYTSPWNKLARKMWATSVIL